MSFFCRSAFVAAQVCLFASAKPAQAQAQAQAQASASDRATARALAGQGYSALRSKDYATAEDRFLRADELVHAPTLVLDHGRALLGLGRIGEAYAAFDSVAHEELPPRPPAVWVSAVKEARAELEKVKPKVAWLILRVSGASDPVVEVDGRRLSSQQVGERLPETPGERNVVVSAPGFITQTLEQRLNAGQESELDIDLQPVPVPSPVIVLAPPLTRADSHSTHPARGGRWRTLTYVSFGAAGLGLAVGTASGILWLKARGDIKSACGGLSCSAQSSNEQSRFNEDKGRYDTFGTLSGVGFGVALAGAAGGAVLLMTGKERAEAEPTQVGIRPYLGPGLVGVYGAFQ